MPKAFTLSFRKIILVGVAIFVVAFSSGAGTLELYYQHQSTSQANFSDLDKIYSILKDKFDGPLKLSKLDEGAKQGLAAATGDPYTVYLTASEAKALGDDLNGTVSGIGAEIGIKNNRLVLIAPIADSPAAKAGLKAGDEIAKINNTDTTTLTLDQAVTQIRGAKGTQVKLTIVRPSEQPLILNITRDVIQVPSVKSSMKSTDIGYIQISQFGSDTADLMTQAAKSLKSQGAKKIILDLRDDPGGYLDAAVKVAGQWLDDKLVVEERKGEKSLGKLYSQTEGTVD